MVGVGTMETGQVLPVEIWIVIHSMHLLLLLRRTHKMQNYTDWHDVDEELRTITILGGFWGHGDFAGFYDRSMDNSGLEEYTVASVQKK